MTENDISPEFISLHKFTAPTRYWLVNDFNYKYKFPIINVTHISLEVACSLLAVFPFVDDDDFPSGKWATIQFLQQLVEDELRKLGYIKWR